MLYTYVSTRPNVPYSIISNYDQCDYKLEYDVSQFTVSRNGWKTKCLIIPTSVAGAIQGFGQIVNDLSNRVGCIEVDAPRSECLLVAFWGETLPIRKCSRRLSPPGI
jgi:hypothetical protein